MANTIAYQKLLAESLDEVLVAALKTGAMEANAAGIKYNGGNKFQFAKMTTDDIGSYNRATGYPSGAVTVSYEEKQFLWDWGQSFLIDAMDVDETNFIATATEALRVFEKDKVAPKMDLYRLATLAAAVPVANKISTAPTAANVYSQILTGLDAVTGETGLDASDFDIYISHTTNGLLCKSSEIQKVLNIGGSPNSINNKVVDINGAAVKVIPDSRMKTLDETPKDIKFIIAHKDAPIAIVKHQVSNIFSPDVNQTADGWKINVRIYHTLEVKDNEKVALYANVSA